MVPGRTSERPKNIQYSVSRRHDDSGVRVIEMRLKFENILEIKPDDWPGSPGVVINIRCGVVASRDRAADRGKITQSAISILMSDSGYGDEGW